MPSTAVGWQHDAVRWDDLFADLDGQLGAAEAAELQAEVAERSRAEQARLMLVERLAAQLGQEVRVGVAGMGAVTGRLADAVGAWLVLSEGAGRSVLVPAHAWLWVDGLGRTVSAPAGPVTRRATLGTALRVLAARRVATALHLRGGTVLEGTIDRVGRGPPRHRPARCRRAAPPGFPVRRSGGPSVGGRGRPVRRRQLTGRGRAQASAPNGCACTNSRVWEYIRWM